MKYVPHNFDKLAISCFDIDSSPIGQFHKIGGNAIEKPGIQK